MFILEITQSSQVSKVQATPRNNNQVSNVEDEFLQLLELNPTSQNINSIEQVQEKTASTSIGEELIIQNWLKTNKGADPPHWNELFNTLEISRDSIEAKGIKIWIEEYWHSKAHDINGDHIKNAKDVIVLSKNPSLCQQIAVEDWLTDNKRANPPV